MRILILAVLLVSVCVSSEALFTMKLVRKIGRIINTLKKERLEEANRNENGIFKDKGLNILRFHNS